MAPSQTVWGQKMAESPAQKEREQKMAGPAATDSDRKKEVGCKELIVEEFIIDVPPAIETDQWPECCIYRVPKVLRQVNENAYTPKLIRVGPIHYGMQEPRDMKMQKLIYLREFCSRTGKSQKDLSGIIKANEIKIRHCYSETFEISSEDFVKIILLDASFIIELFLRKADRQKDNNLDYIISKPCLLYHIEQDLILLENQLPFIVLKELYNFAFNGLNDQATILKLACDFLSAKYETRLEEKEVKHFTDLLRIQYHPSKPWESTESSYHIDDFYGATKLDEAGVKFKAVPDKGLLDIEFKKAQCLELFPCLNFSWLLACLPCLKHFTCLERMQPLLEVPPLVVEDRTEGLFRNIMALEQCHYPNQAYFCNYIVLLDYLIDTEKDMELLVERKVIVNMLGSNDAVATIINKLCLQIYVDHGSYYFELSHRLKRHCDNHWSRIMATMARVYFGDFWRGAATVIGLVFLLNSLWDFIKPFVMKK